MLREEVAYDFTTESLDLHQICIARPADWNESEAVSDGIATLSVFFFLEKPFLYLVRVMAVAFTFWMCVSTSLTGSIGFLHEMKRTGKISKIRRHPI
jgi:hypothetical protein